MYFSINKKVLRPLTKVLGTVGGKERWKLGTVGRQQLPFSKGGIPFNTAAEIEPPKICSSLERGRILKS